MSKIVQLRKKGGLGTIKTKGRQVDPKQYQQERKDHNSDGELVGDYKGGSMPGSKYYLSPMWSGLKNRWSWGGTMEELAECIRKLKLRHPEGHAQAGKVIEPENVNDRLINVNDDFFNHPELYGKMFMESGAINFDLSIPMHRFFYHVYNGDHLVDNKREMSKFRRAGTKFEMVTPKMERKMKAETADKEVEAITLLGAMKHNEDRMRAIAMIMRIPGYSDDTETSGVYIMLKDQGAQNLSTNRRFGPGKTYQDRFIELAKTEDGDLEVIKTIVQGKLKGIIRRDGKVYSFQGKRLEGTTDEVKLIQHFRDIDNQNDYFDLKDLLDSAYK